MKVFMGVDLSEINCRICKTNVLNEHSINTFHYCFIPINNKYMNVNIL